MLTFRAEQSDEGIYTAGNVDGADHGYRRYIRYELRCDTIGTPTGGVLCNRRADAGHTAIDAYLF